MKRAKVATVWLDGCSGCHMSLLDMDAALIDVARKIEIVYGPLVDAQEIPEDIDVTLVEGAVANKDDVAQIQKLRSHTKFLIALGDCAVTSNVPAMRNTIPVNRLLQQVYGNSGQEKQIIPSDGVPQLLKQARPVHEFVKVDLHVPGCPPPAKAILGVLSDLLAGKKPDVSGKLKFG
jgi:NAD-reducing hydrogenase small subunit